MKTAIFFLIFSQKRSCGCSLELPQLGGSNKYPQSLFWTKLGKRMYTPVNLSSFLLYKSRVKRGLIYMDVFAFC